MKTGTDAFIDRVWAICQECGIRTITRVEQFNDPVGRWSTLALCVGPYGGNNAPFEKPLCALVKRIAGEPNDAAAAADAFVENLREWLAAQSGDTLEIRSGPETSGDSAILSGAPPANDGEVYIYMRCRVTQ